MHCLVRACLLGRAHIGCGVDICAVLHQVLDNIELALLRGDVEDRAAVLMERRAQGKHRR